MKDILILIFGIGFWLMVFVNLTGKPILIHDYDIRFAQYPVDNIEIAPVSDSEAVSGTFDLQPQWSKLQ